MKKSLENYSIIAVFVISDLLLLALISISPSVAWLSHAALTVLFFGVLISKTGVRGAKGFATFIFFGILLCLLAPFVGFLAIGRLICQFSRRRHVSERDSNFVVGNPLRESSEHILAGYGKISDSLVDLMQRNDHESLINGIGVIKGLAGEPAVRLLRRLRDHSGALASLHAGSALSVLSAKVESEVSAAENRLSGEGESLDANYRAGDAYLSRAESGTVADDEKEKLYQLAIEQFRKNVGDRYSVIAALDCAVKNLDDNMVESLIGQLKTFSNSDAQVQEYLCELHAMRGQWRNVGQLIAGSKDIPDSVIKFWR